MTPAPSPEDIARRTAALPPSVLSMIIRTDVVYDPEGAVWLKCEQDQQTGSFKWRGAISKLSGLPAGTPLVTASTGNHGLAVARAAEWYGLQAILFLPAGASPLKKAKLAAAGVDIIEVEGDSLAAELAGKQYAAQHQLEWVSPYNDPAIIAGQGTIGRELEEQIPDLQCVYITVGGGGLAAGIGSWLKSVHPRIRIVGCQPAHSPEMYLSMQAGRVVEAPDARETLSDGSAGPLEEDSITFDLCRRVVDAWILVSEAEIEAAIRHLYRTHGFTVEGSAAVAYAASRKDRDRTSGGTSAVVLCGGNIDPAVHRRILENGSV